MEWKNFKVAVKSQAKVNNMPGAGHWIQKANQQKLKRKYFLFSLFFVKKIVYGEERLLKILVEQ